jgi:hypothetical protein
VNGATYHACVQGEDAAGNLSAWVASALTTTVDTTVPTVLDVTSSFANGAYKAGSDIEIDLLFSETVVVTNDTQLRLRLETGSTDQDALYLSGSGSHRLTFHYVVQAGDSTADLNTQSTSALSLGATGTIQDNAGNNAVLTLPNALSANKDIAIDTTNPTLPASVHFLATESKLTDFPLAWTDSTDTNFWKHQIMLCSAGDCATGCGAAVDRANSPATLSGTSGSTYFACVRALDKAGNASAWVASSGSLHVDSTAPTVTSVSSAKADGYYKVGETIDIAVTFSENVSASGDVNLKLETGATDQTAA